MMMRFLSILFFVSALVCYAGFAAAADQPRISKYSSLNVDTAITSASHETILESRIANDSGHAVRVLINSDGTLDPEFPTRVHVVLLLDGKPVSNTSDIDWLKSYNPASHSFNLIATADLGPGDHVVALAGWLDLVRSDYSVMMLKGANISVLQSSAVRVQESETAKATKRFFTDKQDVPVFPFLTLGQPITGRAAVLFSGSVYGTGGDAMLGISPGNAECPYNNFQSWTVNDLYDPAENEAPVFSQAVTSKSYIGQPQAFGSVLPWVAQHVVDEANYRVRPGAKLISIEGPQILGLAQHLWGNAAKCDPHQWRCIASSQGHYDDAGCIEVDKPYPFVTTLINIPSGHDGSVLLLAKTRIQGDIDDVGGRVLMWLTVDGQEVGSRSLQELPNSSSVSQRTVGISYLADATHPLTAGSHWVTVWLKAMELSNFMWVSANNDLTLIYFD